MRSSQYIPASLDDIKSAIANQPAEETIHRFICDERSFQSFESLFEKHRVVGLTYDCSLEHLEFVKIPSHIHAMTAGWFLTWGAELKTRTPLQDLTLATNPTLDFPTGRKQPDALIYPDLNATHPSIGLEVGISESKEELQNDARILLEGSKGQIKLVVLVKIDQPLQPDDTTLHGGTLQLWRYNDEEKKAVFTKVSRQIYPPDPEEPQVIQLTWDDILPDQLHPRAPKKRNPPPLCLNELRKFVDRARKLDVERWKTRKAKGEA